MSATAAEPTTLDRNRYVSDDTVIEGEVEQDRECIETGVEEPDQEKLPIFDIRCQFVNYHGSEQDVICP